MTRIIFFQIFIFLPFIIFCLDDPKRYEAYDYDFNGKCFEDEPECLPFSNISFSYIWSNISESEIIAKGNEYLKNNPKFKYKLQIERSRLWYKKKLGLFALEKIPENTTIADLDISDIYTSEFNIEQFKNSDFYELHKSYPNLKFQSDKQDDDIIQICLNLLYHFYHFEHSPLKIDLLLFPSKPETPLFRLSKYELSLLKTDDSYPFIRNMRNYIKNMYDRTNQIIDQSGWTPEMIKNFFNRTNISLDDWTYVYFLVSNYAVSHGIKKNNQNQYLFFIPSFLKLVSKRPELENEEIAYIHSWDIKGNNTLANKYMFFSNMKYLKKDEIIINMVFDQDFEGWVKSGYLEENPKMCINSIIVPKELSKTSNLPNYYCLSRSDEFLLNKIYLTGNMLNMEEKHLKKCQNKLASHSNLNDNRRIEIIFNECKHPKWTKINIFQGILKELDERMTGYQIGIVEAENVAARKLKDSTNHNLALELRDYLKKKFKLCEWILGAVKNLKKINRNLSKLKDKDRKKALEKLEEKLDKQEEEELEREMREEL